MKLLLLLPSIEYGGAEMYACTICAEAIKKGWEVHAAFPEKSGTLKLIKKLNGIGVRYRKSEIQEPITQGRCFIKKKNQLLRFFKTLIILHKVNPDSVLLVLPWVTYGYEIIIACALLRFPSTVVFQLIAKKEYFGLLKRKIYQWALNQNQQWVTVSENNRQILCDSLLLPKPCAKIIYNGIAIDKYKFSQEENKVYREKLLKELDLPNDAKIILTVAALRPKKGYECLIPVIPVLKEEFPNIRFVWVGEGKNKNNLEKLIQENNIADIVTLLGFREDIPELMTSADLFVFPTYQEGHPFALMEAIAANLPVITSDASGITEIVTHMQQGFVCNKGNSQDFLKAIRYALLNEESMSNMAHNALVKLEEFSDKKMLDETFSAIINLCETSYE